MIPTLPWLSALSDIVLAATCAATVPPWVGRTLSLYGRAGSGGMGGEGIAAAHTQQGCSR